MILHTRCTTIANFVFRRYSIRYAITCSRSAHCYTFVALSPFPAPQSCLSVQNVYLSVRFRRSFCTLVSFWMNPPPFTMLSPFSGQEVLRNSTNPVSAHKLLCQLHISHFFHFSFLDLLDCSNRRESVWNEESDSSNTLSARELHHYLSWKTSSRSHGNTAVKHPFEHRNSAPGTDQQLIRKSDDGATWCRSPFSHL